MMRQLMAMVLLVWVAPFTGLCAEADVVDAVVKKTGNGIFHFDVTVRHSDSGWDHYADKWEVLTPDGTLVGTRTLYHPHVDEQPFTRSLSGVKIPVTVSEVTVRARDTVHAYGGKTLSIPLPR